MTAPTANFPLWGAGGLAPGPRGRSALALLVLGLAVLAVYFPTPTKPGDNALLGYDFVQLHLHRIQFAQAALLGPHPHLPGWYPRELLGTPFWSNIQNFPLIPTRLVLLLFDPPMTYAVGVILSAELSALAAFAFGRALGLGRIGAGAAGWTFACSGFFAARVMCGHLPLLEAYPALPLLLWLVHRCLVSPPGRRRTNALRILGLTTTLVCLAGHPQIPAYAITAAGAFAIWMNHRRPGVPRRDTIRILATLGLAVGVAAFVLYPMALLVARSTRILPLDPAQNDVAFPYGQMVGFIFPWHGGWPGIVARPPSQSPWFGRNEALFWETFSYVGILPLAAAIFWMMRATLSRTGPRRAWAFVVAVGVLGLLLALPPMHELAARAPGVLFRAPARLIYFTVFAIACGFGAGVDWLLSTGPGKAWPRVAVAIVLLVQGFDLGHTDRCFIRTFRLVDDQQLARQITDAAGTDRVGIDMDVPISVNRQVDDVGYFDSIALAKSYRAVFDLAGLPRGMNLEYIDGSNLNVRALRICGVRAIVTTKVPSDQKPSASGQSPLHLYGVAGAADRVDFFPLTAAVIADSATIHAYLRDPNDDLLHRLLIPTGSATPPSDSPTQTFPATIGYTRDSEDQMTISAAVPQSGYLRIDEAWDPGWHATVDDNAVPLIAGDDVFLTLPLPPGYHKVHLEFSTPGATTGWIVSIACFGMQMWITRRRRGKK